MKLKPSFFWIDLESFSRIGFLAEGILSLSFSPMVQKKLLIDSAKSALVEICFPSIFNEEMLVVLDFLFKTLLIVFHVLWRSPSQVAILSVKYSCLTAFVINLTNTLQQDKSRHCHSMLKQTENATVFPVKISYSEGTFFFFP